MNYIICFKWYYIVPLQKKKKRNKGLWRAEKKIDLRIQTNEKFYLHVGMW